MPNTRILLVTFDAFGTLFTPRLPIATQYQRLAKEHGLAFLTEPDIQHSFKRAFKENYTKRPNYGKAVGMSPEEWWTDVINGTFTPFTKLIPPSLAPALISHFASGGAYALHPMIPQLLTSLRSNTVYSRTVLGVVSNSDPRVPLILRSLGVVVKHSVDSGGSLEADQAQLDFVTLSYDVGVEKPGREIFEAAFDSAASTMGGVYEWEKVHVGDDIEKDVEGARRAGWRAVLWDGEGGEEKEVEVLKKILGTG